MDPVRRLVTTPHSSIVLPRSLLYECICVLCAKGDSLIKHGKTGTNGCSGCFRVTCGASFCLYCCRERQLCVLCSSTLEVTFASHAKRKSFRSFCKQFQRETMILLLVCKRFNVSEKFFSLISFVSEVFL